MPYNGGWVMAEILLVQASHLGSVTVYHVYKNNDVTQGRRIYWFTTNPRGGENCGDSCEFDARELSTYETARMVDPNASETEVIRAAIRAAVMVGELKPFAGE